MAIFQVSSRTESSGTSKRRPSRVRLLWYNVLLRVITALIVAAFAVLLGKIGLFFLFFLLLPVGMSIVTTRSQLSRLLHGTLLYDVLTIGLALIYYGSVTGIQILIHTPGFGLLYLYHGPPVSLFIVVTTTLAWAVLLAPLLTYGQRLIDQRFNRQDYEAARAVEAFTSTLREEIDLDKVRDGLLTVVQQTMQPQFVSVWVRKAVQHEMGSLPEIFIADNDPLIGYALSHSEAIEVERLQLDSPVLHTLKTNEVEIVLPLVNQGELIGLLALGPRLHGQGYAHENRSLLNSLADQVAPALRVGQMVQTQQAQVREHERIEQELQTAQDIQHTFLPKDVPPLPGWRLVPYYQPAREVGGDFYDFLPFEDGRLGPVIGDVTDKGIPAALVMMATRTMLRTAAQEKASPGEVFARVNELLYADIPSRMFVTCFYAILDLGSGQMIYANAGHDLPYRRNDGGVSELWATGMPLGMMPGTCYEEYEVTLAPGESLLFYTDGLVEAHNPRREMFGLFRLKTLLAEHSDGTSLIDFLLSELSSFTGQEWEQEDDVTMMILQRTPESRATAFSSA
ncbi:MAG TPA: GAF domain-containing SpoIIE family protein phosphatase [Ktedonobacteraceae bacterium]|nr:GAF domain-containing SpoIIE family protein phosphatase [Ktedonobacteraceae bacterium]